MFARHIWFAWPLSLFLFVFERQSDPTVIFLAQNRPILYFIDRCTLHDASRVEVLAKGCCWLFNVFYSGQFFRDALFPSGNGCRFLNFTNCISRLIWDLINSTYGSSRHPSWRLVQILIWWKTTSNTCISLLLTVWDVFLSRKGSRVILFKVFAWLGLFRPFCGHFKSVNGVLDVCMEGLTSHLSILTLVFNNLCLIRCLPRKVAHCRLHRCACDLLEKILFLLFHFLQHLIQYGQSVFNLIIAIDFCISKTAGLAINHNLWLHQDGWLSDCVRALCDWPGRVWWNDIWSDCRLLADRICRFKVQGRFKNILLFAANSSFQTCTCRLLLKNRIFNLVTGILFKTPLCA